MFGSSLRKNFGSRRRVCCVTLWTAVFVYGFLSFVGVIVHTYQAVHCEWNVIDGSEAQLQGYISIQMQCRLVGAGLPVRKSIPAVPIRVYPRNPTGDSVYSFNVLAVLSVVEMWFILSSAGIALWCLLSCTRNLVALFSLPLMVVGEWAVRFGISVVFFVLFKLSATETILFAVVFVFDTIFRFVFADTSLSLYRIVAAGGTGRERLSVRTVQRLNYREMRQQGDKNSTLEPSGSYRPSRATLARFPHTGTAKSAKPSLLAVNNYLRSDRNRTPPLTYSSSGSNDAMAAEGQQLCEDVAGCSSSSCDVVVNTTTVSSACDDKSLHAGYYGACTTSLL
eukprot:Lankesteria_metandrocarpae@DN4466_c1_g1_i2.p1